MADPIFKPRLPASAEDGQQVLTSSGNIFEFNAEKNEWVCIGVMPNPELVTLDNDGLVPPDLYRKLALVQELIEKGFDFSSFKLDTDVQDPYFYFFHSSDDLIKFSPEKCLDPKEVKYVAIAFSIIDNEDGTSFLSLGADLTADFTGFTLETTFCNYNIIASSTTGITIDADKVNILAGDEVKVIKPEIMSTKLRIEIDRGRLYQKLMRNCCVGPKGIVGDVGDTGTGGASASDEVFQLPFEVTGNVFSWESDVETPIGTPISLRMFRQEDDEVVIIEIVHPLDDSPPMVIINDEAISIEETSFESSYDPTSGKFIGSVVVSGEDVDTWRFKARQSGAKGKPGVDGKPFLEVITSLLDDPSIRSTDAVLSMRKGAANGNVIIFRNSLFSEVPVSNLSASGGVPISNILEDQFTSVSVTVEEAKDIGFYQFVPKPFAPPPLDIPLWTPTSDCVQSRRWVQYKYDWFNRTEPDYLFSILLDPKPPEQCCQEDFFFCPNIGDNPCGVVGGVLAPTPSLVDCECECENPIASELSAGGLVLPVMDLTSPEAAVSPSSESGESGESAESGQDDSGDPAAGGAAAAANVDSLNVDVIGSGGQENLVAPEDIKAVLLNTVESIIDGAENVFTQDIKLVGNGEIIVSLDYDPDPCGGAMVERQSCAFVDSNAVRSFLTLTDRSGTSTISGAGVLEAVTIPSVIAFTVTGMRTVTQPVNDEDSESSGSPGYKTTYGPSKELEIADLQLKITVNTTGVKYCRGYRLTVTAVSDENVIVCPSEEVVVICDDGSFVDIREKTFIDLREDEDDEDETEKVPFTPDTSFAADARVISGGIFTDQVNTAAPLLETANFVQHYGVRLFAVSGTGDSNIFMSFNDTDVGELLKSPSPSQTPLVHDGLQTNSIINVGDFALNMADAGFDTEGPLGIGTYVLGNDFTTTWGSRIPNVDVRVDTWTEVIAFFSEPQNPCDGDVFRMIVMGRLRSSKLVDTASSTYADDLFNSGIDDGFFVYNGVLNGDPMTAIKGGSITFSEDGWLTIAYQEEDVDHYYPETVIEIFIPGNPPITSPPGITDISVVSSNSEACGASSYAITFTPNSVLSDSSEICIEFPPGFNIETINSIESDDIDGTFTAVKNGQTLRVFRADGNDIEGGTELTITVGEGMNAKIPGEYGWTISTKMEEVIIDGPSMGFDDETIIESGQSSSEKSTAYANPSFGLEADGVEASTIYVTVLDDFDNPVQGAAVSISSPVGSDIVAQPAFATDINGETFGTVAAVVAGSRIISVTVNGDIIDSMPEVVFSSGAVSNFWSTVEAPSGMITANGVDYKVITVCVNDGMANPVEGATVTIASTGSSNTITQPASPTDEFGKTTGMIATTVAETKIITATINGSLLLTDTAIVSAAAGPPSDGMSAVTASPVSGIESDGVDTTTIMVVVKDAFSNPVGAEAVTLSSTGSSNVFTPVSGVTNASGIFQAFLSSTVDEGKTISANLTASIGVLTDTASATFVMAPPPPGMADQTQSGVTMIPDMGIEADGVDFAFAEVLVRDAGGNPIMGEAVTVSASPATGVVFSPSASGLTNAFGFFEPKMTTTNAGIYTVTADLTASIGPLINTDDVTFDSPPSGVPMDSYSTVTAVFPGAGVPANGIDAANITVIVLDGTLTGVSGEAVTLSSTGSGNTFTPVSGFTDIFGVFTSSLTSTVVESKTVSADLTGSIGILTQMPNIGFIAPPPPSPMLDPYLVVHQFNYTLSAFPIQYTFWFEADFDIPADAKFVYSFIEPTGAQPDPTSIGAIPPCDGGVSTSVIGSVVTVTRDGLGTITNSSAFSLPAPLLSDWPSVTNCTNPTAIGFYTIVLDIKTNADVIIASGAFLYSF